MAGQERREVRLDADRPHARPAAAVRNAESLVKIHVAHIGADVARTRETYERVEIGAVEIDLAAVRMCDRTNLADGLLENAVRRGIGDHRRSQSRCTRFGLGAEVREVYIAFRVRRHDDDVHSAHGGGSGIGAVSGRWIETYVAMLLPATSVIRADGEQSSIFALRAGIGLQREGVIASDLAKLVRQILNYFRVAESLTGGREGMDLSELRPGDGQHLGRGVELHRAGAERDHGAIEREVAIREAAHVTRHLTFRPVHA